VLNIFLCVKDEKNIWLIKILWSNLKPNKILTATCTWTQHLAKLGDTRSRSSLDPYISRLSVWLSLRILSLTARHTLYVETRCLVDPKGVESDSSPNIYMIGISVWLGPRLLGLEPRPELYISGLNTRLSLRLLGLATRWIHVCLGTILGWA